MENIFNMTFRLPPLMHVDDSHQVANGWTLDSSGKTDANKWPCCG